MEAVFQPSSVLNQLPGLRSPVTHPAIGHEFEIEVNRGHATVGLDTDVMEALLDTGLGLPT